MLFKVSQRPKELRLQLIPLRTLSFRQLAQLGYQLYESGALFYQLVYVSLKALIAHLKRLAFNLSHTYRSREMETLRPAPNPAL